MIGILGDGVQKSYSRTDSEYLMFLADKMLTSKPSVAAIGTLKDLPEYKDIELALLDKSGLMKTTTGKRMFKSFR